MFKDSKLRTFLKTISWRITATTTTVIIVYIFTGQIETAIEVGLLEMVAKMFIYYVHERGWDKLKFGKVEVPSMVIWITGIPYSGKTTLGDMIAEELEKEKRKHQRLDSHTVRALFPNVGFSKDEVNSHIKRVGHLSSILEKNGIIAIASFVSPYAESRDFVRGMCKNFVEVHLESTAEFAKQFDEKGFFEKAFNGELEDVPGVTVDFEKSEKAELTFDMQKTSLEKVKKEVMKFVRENY
ncbi:MAG: adenylyl-sulfate kinase [Calditrichaeota bacterium]|nr:MAG: adenylyl-sulfate kinase [Calditrichota bacterium]MBL1206667.1 adenylyl-sulfate kinase [Calditrichota bacterium]NOG46494.1 adenylyl-sulfate kinase [Calditrichota bacterium]